MVTISVIHEYTKIILKKCSTWNKYPIFVVIAVLISCKNENPKPELQDQIYLDIQNEISMVEKNIQEATSKLEEAKKNYAGSKPQDGTIKRNFKIYSEMLNLKDKYEQQKLYWKIKLYSRLKYIRKATVKNKNEKELKKILDREMNDYLSEKKLRNAKNTWDIKQRFSENNIEYNPLLLGEGPKVKREPAKSNH